MKTKAELQEELRQIEEKEFNELIEKHYPEFKALEGKCFKVRNCYSLPETESDYWFLYVKIQKIDKDDLYKSSDNILSRFHGWSFQTDKYGSISVEFDYNSYVHSMSEETEISNEEFKEAWLKLQSKLSTAYV